MSGEARAAREPMTGPERTVLLAIGAIALAARLPLLFARRPLWLDEALLAQNLADPGRGLLDPLYNLQAAPIGFVVPVQVLVSILGLDERVFRLLPFTAGLATVFVVWAAGRRLFDRPTAAFAAAFAAASPLLIRYGNELKPYAMDALLAALALLLAARWMERPDARRDAMLVLGGCVIVLGSIPGIFVVAGTALGILAATEVATFRRRAAAAGATLLASSALFAVLYFGFYRATEGRMLVAFQPYVGLGREAALAARGFLGWTLVGPGAEAALPPGIVGIMGLAVAGGLVLLVAGQRRRRAGVLAGPILALGAAYAMGRWPLTPRVLLWCLPAVVVLAAVTAEAIRRAVSTRAPSAVGTLAAATLLVPALVQGWITSSNPPLREDVPAAMDALRDSAVPRGSPAAVTAGAAGGGAYIAAHALPACRFYSGGIPERWVCDIPGVRIVEGDWIPVPVSRAGTSEWAAREAELIERELPEETWLLLAGGREARSAIVGAVRSHGREVLERRDYAGVELVRMDAARRSRDAGRPGEAADPRESAVRSPRPPRGRGR